VSEFARCHPTAEGVVEVASPHSLVEPEETGLPRDMVATFTGLQAMAEAATARQSTGWLGERLTLIYIGLLDYSNRFSYN
jgi:hypothetical protein